ncbi:rve-domain-containing [Lasius niger]|uniref:Rve-domain-containing n=1 Tax=Lasius niger TaxID=67767 RepID=A0A0J7K7P9_LASNI|nr:rve-domain-containing [Lasius niger]
MSNKGVVVDLKIDQISERNPFCEGCIYGKQHRLSFPKSAARRTSIADNLMKFYAEVEADGHKIKRLRSDGGLEFCNESVRRFLLNKGIKHEVSTSRAPEQNGFIERQNRTIIESAKAMLHERQLPLHCGQKQRTQQCI